MQSTFGYGFKCYAKTDLEAIYTTAAGAETTIDPNNYSMDGLGLDAGGNVVFSPVPIGGGKVTFRLNPIKEQGTNLRNQGPYDPETVERMADRIEMQLLSQAEELSRAVKVDISSGINSTEYLSAAQGYANAAAISADEADSSEASALAAAAAAAVSAAAAAAAGAGLKYRNARVATTANGTLSTAYANGQTVDGVVLITGDRILLKNQTNAAQNGIYTVNPSGSPTRATDMDIWVEVVSSVVLIAEGTTNTNSVWLCTSNDGGTIGVTDITFIDYGSTIVNGSLALSKLAAIAASTIVANATGGSASPTAVVIAANQFLARASTGSLGVKSISDDALAFVAALNNTAMRASLGAAASGANTDISTIVAGRPENLQTDSYTLVLADAGKNIRMNKATANNLTVPPNSSVAFPLLTEIDLCQYGAGQTTVVAGVGVTIRSKSGNLKLTGQYSGATMKKIGTDEWMLFGDLTA